MRTGRIQHAAEADGWCWFNSAGAQTDMSKRAVRKLMAETMETGKHTDDLRAWLGGYGSGSMSKEFTRELTARARRNKSAPFPCGPDHYGGQIESKTFALVTGNAVFVLTPGHETGLKFSPKAGTPRSVPISVASMGPRGRGDAQVTDEDIILIYNGTNHYNSLITVRE